MPVALQPACGEEVEQGTQQVEAETVEDRVAQRLVAISGLHRIRHEAKEENAEADADQIVDEEETCRGRGAHVRWHDMLDGVDYRSEPGEAEIGRAHV